MADSEVIAWIGNLSAGLALGSFGGLLVRRAARRTVWAACLPALAYALLAELTGPVLSGAVHLVAAALAGAAVCQPVPYE